MRIAIVTAYCAEPVAKLERCRNSVLGQITIAGHDVHQIMIADGNPQSIVDAWEVTHIRIPPQRDCGDTPRMIGAMLAVSGGYDALAFLDADNWYEPGFIGEMAGTLAETKAGVVTCPRWLWRMDRTRMRVDDESDGISFNDTSCYLFSASSSFVFNAIAFKRNRHDCLIGDRLLWKGVLQSGIKVARVQSPLLNYETNNAWHYLRNSETPPPGAKYLVVNQKDRRAYQCLYEDVTFLPDGSPSCPPERLMAPDGSRPFAKTSPPQERST